MGRSVSSAEFIEDVNEDPVVIVDGLTKVSALIIWQGQAQPHMGDHVRMTMHLEELLRSRHCTGVG